LVYSSGDLASSSGTPSPQTSATDGATPPKAAHHKKNGLFERIGHFFRRIFGAE
jgi:hypothetical protein